MLMSVADIEARSGQVFGDEQLDQVQSLIDDVTGLVEEFLGRSYDTAVPPRTVKAVSCMEVRRHLNMDPGIATERVGDLSTGYTYQGAVVALSSDTVARLRPYRRRSGIGSIQLISHLVPPPAEEEEEAP